MRNGCSYLSLFLVLGCVINLSAQDYLQRQKLITRFEIVGGIGKLMSYGTFEGVQRPMYSKLYGIGISHSFSKAFELNFRVLEEYKGNKYNDLRTTYIQKGNVVQNLSTSVETDMQYLTFSLLPTIHFGTEKNILVGLGAYYSRLQKAKAEISVTDTDTNTTTNNTNRDLRNWYSKYDYGLSAFAGYSFPIGEKDKIILQIMYNLDLQDENDAWNVTERYDSFTFVAAFSIFNSTRLIP